MWKKSHSKIFTGIKKEEIWKIWSDIDHWNLWDEDIESSSLVGSFKKGSFFTLKPKGFNPVHIQLSDVVKNKSFTDCTKFPGALMYGHHEIEEVEEGVNLTITMSVSGFLSFVWVSLVARGIIKKAPKKMDSLVKFAGNKK